MTKAELEFYGATVSKARAYVKLLEAVNEVQSFSLGCFEGYPNIKPKCELFEKGCFCTSETCPLTPMNKAYINAEATHEKARIALMQAQTAVLGAIVKS